MSGCKRSIWKILSAGVALFLMLPSLALGEFGVCPPYSKTFGPDNSPEEILAFVSEVNARPGGGTLILEPGSYHIPERVVRLFGTMCVRSASPDIEEAILDWNPVVASGAVLTLRSVKTSGDLYIHPDGWLFCDSASVQEPLIEGTVYCLNSKLKGFYNLGVLVLEGGEVEAGTHFPDDWPLHRNAGYASLNRVTVWGVKNAHSGTLTISRSTINARRFCPEGPKSPGCVKEDPAIINYHDGLIAEVAHSVVETCEGPVTDLGHNEFYVDGGCIVTDPTSTYYTDDMEVVVRTTPYWRSVGTVHLDTDTALFVSVFSTPDFDARSIDYYTVDIEGFDRGALRGGVYRDSNRDGLMDYVVWYRLDRQLRLDCGSYDNAFSAMTTDGLSLTGRLQFEAVGCTP